MRLPTFLTILPISLGIVFASCGEAESIDPSDHDGFGGDSSTDSDAGDIDASLDSGIVLQECPYKDTQLCFDSGPD